MRDYYVRYLKRIKSIKGLDYIVLLKELKVITEDEYDAIVSD